MSLVINIILEIEIINGVLIQIHTHPPLKRQKSPAKKKEGNLPQILCFPGEIGEIISSLKLMNKSPLKINGWTMKFLLEVPAGELEDGEKHPLEPGCMRMKKHHELVVAVYISLPRFTYLFRLSFEP